MKSEDRKTVNILTRSGSASVHKTQRSRPIPEETGKTTQLLSALAVKTQRYRSIPEETGKITMLLTARAKMFTVLVSDGTRTNVYRFPLRVGASELGPTGGQPVLAIAESGVPGPHGSAAGTVQTPPLPKFFLATKRPSTFPTVLRHRYPHLNWADSPTKIFLFGETSGDRSRRPQTRKSLRPYPRL